MIVDLTVRNFRSFQTEQVLSMNVERARNRHSDNYTVAEDGKLAILRSAAILGANAAGKSNVIKAVAALRWMICFSSRLREGEPISPYEPFRLSAASSSEPVTLEIEFIVPSRVRYRYAISFLGDRIVEESLYSFARRQRALVFHRDAEDTWKTIKFGGTYKGGNRILPLFPNNSYLSRAGSDASAPDSMREIYRYFRSTTILWPGEDPLVPGFMSVPENLRVAAEILRLADFGVEEITFETNDKFEDIKIPSEFPESLRQKIIERNKVDYKFWVNSQNGGLVSLDEDAMSEGTMRFFSTLPSIFLAISNGSPILIDEIDAHFHPHLLRLILQLFHDPDLNSKGSQLIFTTHDTNVLDPDLLRRDQVWLVEKSDGASNMRGMEEFDRKLVRQDSPFDRFYMDGRFGAVPHLSYTSVRDAILRALQRDENSVREDHHA